MTGYLTMFDSAFDTTFPRGAQAYGAYVDGQIGSQPNFSWIVAEFPNAHHLSITLDAALDADVLDIETGAATPEQATGWWQRQRARGLERPCLYASASVMQAAIVPLVRSGVIARPLVRLWSAHYSGQHLCGPRSCGGVSTDVDGCQWTDRAFGRSLDESLLLADFFGAAGPAPAAPPAPTVRSWTTEGLDSLEELAGAHGTSAAAVLEMTARHGPAAGFSPEMASWLNGVFGGQIEVTHPMPAGLVLYLPA